MKTTFDEITLTNHGKLPLEETMVECDCYDFGYVQFSDKDIWQFIKAHTRLRDLLSPRKVSALSHFVLYILQADPKKDAHSAYLRENKKWKFKFDKKWKVE